jgi:hypothetical protein
VAGDAGASDATDATVVEGLSELKNGGALRRAAIVPMVKLGSTHATVKGLTTRWPPVLEGPA